MTNSKQTSDILTKIIQLLLIVAVCGYIFKVRDEITAIHLEIEERTLNIEIAKLELEILR